MREFLRLLFEWVHRLIPKRNHAVVYGWPDGEDQSRALEPALQKTRLERVVLLLERPENAAWAEGPKTIRVRKKSLAGIWWFLRARYAFFSHPCFVRRFSKSVVSVNLWHGMPIKKIGALIENDEPIRCSHTLATSPFWGEIMAKTIMRPGGEILPIGLPRNDRLFRPVEGAAGIESGQKLLLWLPTYRTSSRGLPRADGIDYGNAFGMPDVDPAALNAMLSGHDAVMMVKPHPMAAAGSSESWSHLRIINDAWLSSRGLSLYQILGASSVLISDISSVVIDYLLLDRPIIHAFPDLAEYESSRGFTVEPIEDYLAGPVVCNHAELLVALEEALGGGDPHAGTRRELRDLSHQHVDGETTARMLTAIGL